MAIILIPAILMTSGCTTVSVPIKTPSAKAFDYSPENEVVVWSQIQYKKEISVFGWTLTGLGLLGGGYLGVRYPITIEQRQYPIPTAILLGALLGVSAYGIAKGNLLDKNWDNPYPVPFNEAEYWLSNVDNSLQLGIAVPNTGGGVFSLYALPRTKENTFVIKNMADAKLYAQAFGKSPYLINVVLNCLQSGNIHWTDMEEFAKLFPNNQEIADASVKYQYDKIGTIEDCRRSYQRNPKSLSIAEKRALEIAVRMNSLEALQEFLTAFPMTTLRDKVAKRETEVLYNNYKQDYQACSTADDYVNFIAKHKSKDYDKLIPKAQERVKQLRYKEYKDMFATAKSSSDFGAFINKYATNDPDNLIPRAKAAEYQKLFEEANSSSDCSSFIEKYANNDPNGYIPQVQERRATALVREEQVRIAELRRQEEERRIAETFRNTRWEPKVEWNREDDRSKNTNSCDRDIRKTGTLWFYKMRDDGSRSSEWVAVQLEYKYRAYMEGIPAHFCVQEYEIKFFHHLKGGTIEGSRTDGSWRSGCYTSSSDRWPNAFQLGPDEAMQYLATNYINEVLRKPH